MSFIQTDVRSGLCYPRAEWKIYHRRHPSYDIIKLAAFPMIGDINNSHRTVAAIRHEMIDIYRLRTADCRREALPMPFLASADSDNSVQRRSADVHHRTPAVRSPPGAER